MPRNTDRLEAAPVTPISTVAELDDLLLGLCQVDAEIKATEAQAEARVAILREALAQTLAPLQERRQALIHAGTRFLEDRRALVFGRGKSRQLTHGKVGFQQKRGTLQPAGASQADNERIAAQAVLYLKDAHPEAVRVKEEIDKPTLLKLGAEVWKAIRYRLVGEKDSPYLEPDKQLVADLSATVREAGK